MRKHVIKAANRLLRPLGAMVVRKPAEDEHSGLSMDAMLRRLSRRGIPVRSVVDIGASDGKWSVACMQHFPDASYLAIEPLEERRQALETNKSRFAGFDYALCVAGESDGNDITLNVTTDLDGSTVEGRNPGISRTCRVRTIDSLASERNLPGPFLLKFDTHGYEMPILSGSAGVLRDTSAIIMETYNFQLTPTSLRFFEMCAHLESLGFRSADIAEPMLRLHDNAFWQIDILFLKADSEMFSYQHYR